MQQTSRNNTRDLLRQLATFIAIVGAFIVNVLSNIFPINGQTIGEISNTLFRDVLIIPANYAFAIWGLIYLGLFAFAFYQILPDQRNQPDLSKAGYLLIVASIAQAIWVYLFLYKQFFQSVVAMLLILLPLIGVYLVLGIGKKTVSRAKKWCIHYPISIYLGWISVATIVNIASALYAEGWNGWGVSSQVWTTLMLLAATAISFAIAYQRRDIAYPAVTVWALVAIAVKQWGLSNLSIVALLYAFGLTCFIIYTKFRPIKP